MNVIDDEPREPPHVWCLPMTEIEDKILRELHRSGGRMDSETLRLVFEKTESADDLYGALSALHEMRYIDATVISPAVWKRSYRPVVLSLTTRGRTHVLTTEPVRGGWLTVALYLVLVGAIIAGIQSIYQEPDYGPIGISLLSAGVIVFLARQADRFLRKRK